MLSNIPATVATIVAAILLVICGVLYTKGQRLELNLANEQKATVELQAIIAKSNQALIVALAELAYASSTDFETAKVEEQVRVQTIVREIDRVIEKPVYQNLCLDSGGVGLVNNLIRVPIPVEKEDAL